MYLTANEIQLKKELVDILLRSKYPDGSLGKKQEYRRM